VCLNCSWLVSTNSASAGEKHQFQTETKQLLDIVANALYTDRHVFVRELISNSSDACEKVRHRQVTGDGVIDADEDLSIHLYTDDNDGTLTIIDNGIGMNRDEMIQNLGTIAHSGSKKFVDTLKAQSQATTPGGSASNVIGQFGVGFYSAFMVADEISVFSRSADPSQSEETLWHSLGDGSYDLQPATGVTRGTKIVLKLKDSCRDFSNPSTIEDIIKRYSNFVNFPIFLNDTQVNAVQALWTLNKSDVTPQQYEEFYKYKAKAYDKPMMTLHFAADAPIELKVLLFVGQVNEVRTISQIVFELASISHRSSWSTSQP
jgi:HSP90 family molecular chaperone